MTMSELRNQDILKEAKTVPMKFPRVA